jgi:streptogramin lyase
MRLSKFLTTAVAALLAPLPQPSLALDIVGSISTTEGAPLPHVRVRSSGSGAAAFSHTVFSAADGSFAARDLDFDATTLDIDLFRIGWEVTERHETRDGDALRLAVTMAPIRNVARQVPASAWLQGDPDDLGYQMANLHCANCHQLGAERVRNFSHGLGYRSGPDRAEAWVTQAAEDLAGTGNTTDGPADSGPDKSPLEDGWEVIVQYMRWVTMRLGEENELRWGLKEGSPFYEALLQPETSLFSPRDMEVIIPYLARNFPTEFDNYEGYDDIERLGEYGVTAATEIQEYALPTFGWTREIAVVPGSSDIWFLETDKHRLGALNPDDGSVTWYPVPLEGAQGPHTMNSDAKGNVWVALEDSFYIGRLNTASKEWRLYPPPEGTLFGVTHDFAFNSDRHVETDSKGRIFITDLGKNELWALNVESGEIETFRLPIVSGESTFHSLLYGAAIDAKNDRVWWAQLFGVAGSFNAMDDIAERIIPYERGEGPRRLAIQDGILWVPLFGTSELSKIDTATGLELARYRIPDRGSSPYGITLDKKRNAIWAATCNSDRIYRFDIDEEKWTHYPLPRREAYIRVIEVDPDTGDIWTTYSSLPVGKRDAGIWGTESANNMIVRLRPGD